jgi:hypothetical protein
VATARKRVAQTRDLLTWNVDDRTVDPSAQTLAKFESVTPVALLIRAVCLEPYLVRVDHDGVEPKATQLTGNEERDGAGLKSDLSSRRKVIGRLQSREAIGARRHLALRDQLSPSVLDHERALPAVNVPIQRSTLSRAAPPLFGTPHRMTPRSAANHIAVRGGAARLH